MAERSTSKGRPGSEDETEVTLNPAPPGPHVSEEITASTPIPAPMPSAPGANRDPDVEPGTVLGEYSVENKIGQGGMGTVFAAVHPVIGKRAAVKVLRRELCEDPITLERFIDEARVVNQIGHPNIVDVFAFGQLPDGRSYLVMEWLRGESLRERLVRGPLSPVEACALLRPLARALEAAHAKGIVHRDLKPDNVFLVEGQDDVPRVKLLDFGIAKLVRADQAVSRTATGAMIGTPQYVAPEQAKGHAIDARVDIYSLGCVAFELLTGRPPFIADNPMEMVAKHLMEAPMRPSSLVPNVPDDLDDIIVEMLAKDREQRPTLTEITVVLERVQKQPPSRRLASAPKLKDTGMSFAVTRPVEVLDIAQRRRRNARLAKLGILMGGVAMGAVMFMVVSALTKNDKPSAAPPPTPAIEPAAAAAPGIDVTPSRTPPPPTPPPPTPPAAEIELPAPETAPTPAATAPKAPAEPASEPVKHDHPHKTVVTPPRVHKTPSHEKSPPKPPTPSDSELLAPGSLGK